MEAQSQIDEELKLIFLDHAFSRAACYGSPNEQLKCIAEHWDLLYNIISRRHVCDSLIYECDVLDLPWQSYDFTRYELFIGDWEMEIKARLFNKIKEHYDML